MTILRNLVWYCYFFGYMLVHYGRLQRALRARAAGDEATAEEITQYNVNRWCRTLLKLAGVTVTVEGQENIPAGRACVFAANHRSYYDIPLMLTSLDECHGLVAKQEIGKIPLIQGWMRLLRCVYVKRDSIQDSVRALNQATANVKAGHSMTIFPEGTRYKGEEGGIGEFKGGVLRIATKSGAPIVPVAISHSRDIMENNHMLMRPAHVTVRILPPVEVAGLSRAEQKELPARLQAIIQQNISV